MIGNLSFGAFFMRSARITIFMLLIWENYCGSMIPLMTLSIPGSPNAAIILGGLLIQGPVPGAHLFTTQAPITYSILIGFALSNIRMVFVGLLIARYVVHVTRIPKSILMPVVVSLALIGSYAINASMFDVFVAIFFGFLGYLMNKFDLSAAALILGLILGGTAESGLMLSLVLAKGNPLGYYMSCPICLVLIAPIAVELSEYFRIHFRASLIKCIQKFPE